MQLLIAVESKFENDASTSPFFPQIIAFDMYKISQGKF